MKSREFGGARRLVAGVICLIASGSMLRAADDAADRTFTFTYSSKIVGLHPGQAARVWIPVPPNNRDQKIVEAERHLPAPAETALDSRNANSIFYLNPVAGSDGTIPLSIVYRVTRHAVAEETVDSATNAAADDIFLRPDSLVPVGGKSLSLLQGKSLPNDPMQLGRLLYDVVDDHMQYRKDKPGWGRGDSNWACDSGFGNCTDFHSLFISLACANHLPAKFQIGFQIPDARGSGSVAGYHCWAWFKPEAHEWVPVDISEANKHPEKRDYYFGHLDANRIQYTTGRDLVLEPKQAGPPLNYFVYPYVEVDGNPYPAEKIEKSFSYADETR